MLGTLWSWWVTSGEGRLVSRQQGVVRGPAGAKTLFRGPWESPAQGDALTLGAHEAARTHRLPICLFLHPPLPHWLLHSFTLSSRFLSSDSGRALQGCQDVEGPRALAAGEDTGLLPASVMVSAQQTRM